MNARHLMEFCRKLFVYITLTIILLNFNGKGQFRQIGPFLFGSPASQNDIQFFVIYILGCLTTPQVSRVRLYTNNPPPHQVDDKLETAV